MFSSTALESISRQAGNSNVTFTVGDSKDKLSEEQKREVGDRLVYELSVMAGNKEISFFEEGSATVTLPYTLKEGDDPNAVVIYYLNEEGKLKPLRAAYNKESKGITVILSHFSVYLVGYNKVSFADVSEDAWYSEGVSFLAAREIIKGLEENRFAPGLSIKRGDFLLMVMRAYGLAPDETASVQDNFADAGNTYYTSTLGVAKAKGLAKGIGNNLFAPEQNISRQEATVLLCRILEILNEMPNTDTGKRATFFADSAEIAPWAFDLMTPLPKAGSQTGTGGI